MKFLEEAEVYCVSRPQLDMVAVGNFLSHNGLTGTLCDVSDAEFIPEIAGRVCYMSFGGQGRKTNQEYITHILEMKHGSVAEHSSFGFIIEGISRSCSHEIVRHRAGFAYSQLSQRYVDESDVNFIVPPMWRGRKADPDEYLVFTDNCVAALESYKDLVNSLAEKVKDKKISKTDARKLVRQTARSVLPNATETKIFMTGNCRAWRHFCEQRCSPAADAEIRQLAIQILKKLQQEAKNLFADFEIYEKEGEWYAKAKYGKV